jgi:hypothetical protein
MYLNTLFSVFFLSMCGIIDTAWDKPFKIAIKNIEVNYLCQKRKKDGAGRRARKTNRKKLLIPQKSLRGAD